MNNAPLDLKHDSTAAPIIKLTHQIIKDAVILKADAILMELDTELHLKVQKESEAIREKHRRPSFYEAIFKKRFKDYFRFEKSSFRKSNIEKMFFELGRLPMALKATYLIDGVQQTWPSFHSELFADVIRILQVAAGVSPKTSGEVSAIIETVKPASKWILESKDLTRRIQLRRIRVNQTLPN